jgi:hypothetical protein
MENKLTVPKDNHVPGYEPVLVRIPVKKLLKDFRFNHLRIARDMHIERHLITAAILTVLSDENAKKCWLEKFREEFKSDIDQSLTAS